MNSIKSQARTHFFIGAGLISLSFLANGWDKWSLTTTGIIFMLTALLFCASLWFKWGWLAKAVHFIGDLNVGYLATFVPLCGFGITLIRNGLLLPAITVIYIAYLVVWAPEIGRDLGTKVLRPLLVKLNR
jgi:hypothetical protein